jgi:hypothetical protein
MKARATIFLLLLTIMMMAAPQASALDIRISPNGNIEFYSGSVLGRDDDKGREEKEDEEHDEDEDEDERHDEDEDKFKTVRSNDKKIQVRSRDDKFEVELRDRDDDDEDEDHDFRKAERIETDDVRVKFPARMSDDDRDERHDEDENEEHQRYAEELREERKDRAEEMVELRNKLGEDEQSLELKSRNAKAALKNGAEFTLDPITNEVTITTPSGEEHTLNHLPDQAIERMETAGLFFGISDDAEKEIEVETNEGGELVYKKKDKIEKRIFGMFPRQVDSEIVLNDVTGEVTEVELAGDSIFEQFFNAVSF